MKKLANMFKGESLRVLRNWLLLFFMVMLFLGVGRIILSFGVWGFAALLLYFGLLFTMEHWHYLSWSERLDSIVNFFKRLVSAFKRG